MVKHAGETSDFDNLLWAEEVPIRDGLSLTASFEEAF